MNRYDFRMMDSRGDYADMRRGRRSSRRGMRYDRGYYNSDYRQHAPMDGNYPHSQPHDERGSRYYESGRQHDMGYDYPMMRDGHYHKGGEGKTYYPIEAMGKFNGYWGMPEEDYRGRGRDYGDYNYDMRGRDYNYDYGYDYAGDYGETLSNKEIEHWSKKLMGELEEKDKQFFMKENIMNKAKQMGIKFDKFSEEELWIATLMTYTDYCKTLGSANMDIYIRLAKDWLEDDDIAVKGSEKLAVYFDCIVEGK